MTYATSADIRAELKNIAFTSTSSVTDDAILDFLDQAEALINMYIGQRYVTPVTSAEAILVLKKCEIDIVVYRVTKILDLKKSVPIPDTAIPQDITEGSAYKQCIKLLESIRDNDMDLPGETPINPDSGLASFNTEPGVDNPACFQKGVDQW